MDKINILGSQISIWNLDETVEKIVALLKPSKNRHYVCVSNVHTVVMGMHDSEFAKVTNEASLATADGVPLVWASKVLRGPQIHGRANGPDILEQMIFKKEYNHLRHFFYGSTDSVLKALKENLLKLNSDAQLVGFLSPPIRGAKDANEPLSLDELEDCKIINQVKPDIVWVGLGAPKQEVWMYRARPHLNAAVSVGVGAAFDLLAGTKPRAPVWMQRNGLEWLHRLMSEPRRLTSRYASTNPQFVVNVLKQSLKDKINGENK